MESRPVVNKCKPFLRDFLMEKSNREINDNQRMWSSRESFFNFKMGACRICLYAVGNEPIEKELFI